MKTIHLDKIIEFIPQILPYFGMTLAYVVCSLFFGTALAVLITWQKLGSNKVLRKLAYGYTTVMRCVPSIVLLFLTYYGVIFVFRQFLGIQLTGENKFVYVTVTFSLFIGSSMSEVMRSAYEAVEKGQMEAGLSIGLSAGQVFRRIILPQAFRIAIPNVGNNIIYLFKEGALAYIIGLIDMMGKGMLIKGTNGRGFDMEVYIALACIYWPLSILLEQLFKQLEKRFSKGFVRTLER